MAARLPRQRGVRLLIVLTTLGIVGFWAANAASAHVTVSAEGAVPGGSDQVITFRVPTESDTASTVGLEVQLPTATPIASVLVAPHPGWVDTVTSAKLAKPIVTDDGDITEAVSTITWKATSTANGIKPGQFDQFVIIAGQLPNAKTLTFKAIQTYSDHSVVSWIQTEAPGSTASLDHPAPVLTLGASTPATATKTTKASSTPGVVGAILGGLGLLAGGLALALTLRRRSSS